MSEDNIHIVLLGQGEKKKRVSLPKLVQLISGYQPSGRTPPFCVLNLILKAGSVDAGMSGGLRWKPFQIAVDEYEAISGASESGRGSFVDFETYEEWIAWCYETDFGVPSNEYLQLTSREKKVTQELGEAEQAGDKGKVAALRNECLLIRHSLAKLLGSHILAKQHSRNLHSQQAAWKKPPHNET